MRFSLLLKYFSRKYDMKRCCVVVNYKLVGFMKC